MNAEDFFRVLQEKGIRSKAKEHPNLKEFLQLSPNFPDLIVVKNIKKTLEQMAENEAFMDAIREDVMAGEEEAQLEAERLAKEHAIEEEVSRIREGLDDESDTEQADAPEGAQGSGIRMLNQDNRRLGQAEADEYAFEEEEQYSQDENHYGR